MISGATKADRIDDTTNQILGGGMNYSALQMSCNVAWNIRYDGEEPGERWESGGPVRRTVIQKVVEGG